LWQIYVRWLLQTNRKPHFKILTRPSKTLLLPIYELLLWIDSISALLGLVLVQNNSTAAAYVSSFVTLLYALNPLFIVYTKTMPRTTLAVVRQLAFSIVLDLLAVVPQNAFPQNSNARAYVSLTLSLLIVLIIIGMLFRKNARTRRTAVIVHTCVVGMFIILGIVLVFYAVEQNIVVSPQGEVSSGFTISVLVWMCSWAMSVFTSIGVMYSDTLYWYQMYNNERIINDLLEIHVTPTMDDRLQNLISENSCVFIEFGALNIRRLISSGAHSDVYMGYHGKLRIAAKVLRPPEITPDVIKRWSREISVSRVLEHPNIVKCYGLSIAPPKIIIVYEFCDLSLSQFIEDVKPEFDVALDIMIDVASAVAYLHERKLIHRDIKSQNVILFENSRAPRKLAKVIDSASDSSVNTDNAEYVPAYTAKLIDFGETRHMETEVMEMTVTGTPQYVAPELLQGTVGSGTARYSQKADVFSMATLFWELLHHGKSPFPPQWSIASVLAAVLGGYRPPLDDDFRMRHPHIGALMHDMWSEDDGVRPNAGAVRDFLILYRAGGLAATSTILESPPRSPSRSPLGSPS
jgi:serine/threonine protein kinase